VGAVVDRCLKGGREGGVFRCAVSVGPPVMGDRREVRDHRGRGGEG